MPSLASVVLLGSALLAALAVVGFLGYMIVRYMPIVARIFEEKPMFLPLRVAPATDGEDVTFATRDGLRLAGTYLKARTAARSGVLVFCHEFLSNRWSALPYLDCLRDRGFDLFTFDFRNHGASPTDAGYVPLQWVTTREVDDLDAALAYLRTRPDADRAGVGLFGVSRGGGIALCSAARDPRIWGVITDGAFPTRGTMLAYILRWAEIYVNNPKFWTRMPTFLFDFLGWTARVRTQFKLKCRYADVEGAVRRLAPRPWLAIHGQKDAYIGVAIAEALFRRGGEPKELWVVAGAKHNRCREKDPAAYRDRLLAFCDRFAPRRPVPVAVAVAPECPPPGPTRPVAAPDVTPFATLPVELAAAPAV